MEVGQTFSLSIMLPKIWVPVGFPDPTGDFSRQVRGPGGHGIYSKKSKSLKVKLDKLLHSKKREGTSPSPINTKVLDWINLILMAGVGILAGFYGAVLGLGGGVLLVPALTLFFKVPIHTAIGTSLLCVIATSSTAATNYVQNKLADVRLGMTLELATTIGAICGGVIAGLFKGDVLSIIFSLLLLYSALSMLSKKEKIEDKSTEPGSASSYQVQNLPAGLGFSFLAGNFSGLLGIGGGIIKVPAMYLFMGVPLKVATATSNFMIGVTACAGAFVYYLRGDIDILISGISILGIFLGADLGSRMIHKIKTEYIKIAFIVVLLYLCLEMFLKGIKVHFLFLG